MGVIAARPTSFSSPTAAVAWALRGGMCRCKDAAAVSLPSQLKQAKQQQPLGGAGEQAQGGCGGSPAAGTTAADASGAPAAAGGEVGGAAHAGPGHMMGHGHAHAHGPGMGCSTEGLSEGASEGGSGSGRSEGGGSWVWRTPLAATRPYWEGWYTGLSDAFLQVGHITLYVHTIVPHRFLALQCCLSHCI